MSYSIYYALSLFFCLVFLIFIFIDFIVVLVAALIITAFLYYFQTILKIILHFSYIVLLYTMIQHMSSVFIDCRLVLVCYLCHTIHIENHFELLSESFPCCWYMKSTCKVSVCLIIYCCCYHVMHLFQYSSFLPPFPYTFLLQSFFW